MLFKVRDLLVSYLPGAQAEDCQPDTRCNGCTNQYSDCDAGCSNARTDFSENCPEWRFDPAELVELRELLDYAVARTHVAQLEARFEQRAVERLDEVEKQLRQALEQVREDGQNPHEERVSEPYGSVFRVNDLMITLMPGRFADDADSGCPACTCVAGCSGSGTGCTNTSGRYDTIVWEQEVVLPELRALLDQAVVGVQGRAGRRPRTEDEAKALGGALESALEGIERRRKLNR